MVVVWRGCSGCVQNSPTGSPPPHPRFLASYTHSIWLSGAGNGIANPTTLHASWQLVISRPAFSLYCALTPGAITACCSLLLLLLQLQCPLTLLVFVARASSPSSVSPSTKWTFLSTVLYYTPLGCVRAYTLLFFSSSPYNRLRSRELKLTAPAMCGRDAVRVDWEGRLGVKILVYTSHRPP